MNGQNCYRADFRTIDGSCNNLRYKDRGTTKIPFIREIPAQYGAADVNNSIHFPNRPNPRAISNAIFQQGNQTGNSLNLSSFVFTWGQFLDHDITFSKPARTEQAFISLPPDEPSFKEPIAFTRSAVVPETGLDSPRNQENELTAWIDASQVYGNDAARANWLRTLQNGKLKTSEGNRLPYNTINGQKNGAIDPNTPEMDPPIDGAPKFFVAGDVRAFEQPGLTSLHTLFLREHNRICEELVQQGYNDDEYIYQVARKQIGALIQVITYEEFLPALGIRLNNYPGYIGGVNPEIMNLFATAGFRLGHTMVTDELLVLDDNCTSLNEPISLDQAFLTGKWIEQFNIAPILKGLSVNQQEAIDAKVVDGLRDFLFRIPNNDNPFGLDLAALNIQRGRDHGIPSYKRTRRHFLNQNTINFSEITTNRELQQQLRHVYNNVADIDLWVGLLAEDHLPSSAVGPTLHEILRVQFERIRNGDFYYYLNDPFFSSTTKNNLSNTKLSDVIKRNTTLKNIANDVFYATPCQPIVVNFTCDDALVTAANQEITISSLASGAKVEISGPSTNWTQQLLCEGNCTETIYQTDLLPGTYNITVQTFDPYCYRLYTLPVINTIENCNNQGGDSDGDGICDNQDNCVSTPNVDQADNDNDGIGNVCDDTPDGIIDNKDCNSLIVKVDDGSINLSNIPQSAKIEFSGPSTNWTQQVLCSGNCNTTISQSNLREGPYNITVQTFNPYCYRLYTVRVENCNEDSDGDGVCDAIDNCTFVPNADQADNDNDGIGNPCDDTPNGGNTTGSTVICGETTVTYGAGQIHILGQSGKNYFFKINDLSNGWNAIAQCGWNCGNEFIANEIPNGPYRITVYNSDWTEHCYAEVTMNNSSFSANAGARNAAQLSFAAYQTNREVELQWLTNSGYKVTDFEVERSIDGTNFSSIAQFVNKEWSAEMEYHQTIDEQPVTGENYYRVKEIYLDGSFAYTTVQKIGFAIDLDGIAVFPNPAQNELFISLKPYAGQQGALTLQNQFGQEVKTIKLGELSEDLVQINTSQLLNGIYYLNVQLDKHKSFTKRVVVHHLY